MNKKTKLLILGSILVVVGLILSVLLFTMLKTDKIAYLKLEEKHFDSLTSDFIDYYQKSTENYNKVIADKSESDYKLEINNLDESLNGLALKLKMTRDIPNSSYEMALNADTTGMKKEMSSEGDANLELALLLINQLKAVISINQENVKIKGPVGKTIKMSLENLETLLKDEGIMKEEDSLRAFLNKDKKDTKQQRLLMEKYKRFIIDTIPEESVVKGKEKVEIEGKDKNLTKYTIELTGQDMQNIISNVINEMIKDQELLALSGMTKEAYQLRLKEIEELKEVFELDIKVKNEIWVKGDKILKRKISISQENEDMGIQLISTYKTKKSNIEIKTLLSAMNFETMEEEEGLEINSTIEKNKNNAKLNMQFTSKSKETPVDIRFKSGITYGMNTSYEHYLEVKDTFFGDVAISVEGNILHKKDIHDADMNIRVELDKKDFLNVTLFDSTKKVKEIKSLNLDEDIEDANGKTLEEISEIFNLENILTP